MSKFKVCYNVMTHKQTQCQAVSIAERKFDLQKCFLSVPAGWLTVAVQLYEGPCRQLREESEPLAYFPTMKTAKEKHFLPVTLTLRQTFDSAPFRPNRKST